MNNFEIKNSGMQGYANPDYEFVHHGVLKICTETGWESIGLTDAFGTAYESAQSVMTDIVNRTYGSEKTTLMRAQDDIRCEEFRAIRNLLRVSQYSNNESVKALYGTISKKLISVYKASVISEPDQKKTAHLYGFAFDVKKYLTESQIQQLGIKEHLAAMEAANQGFEQQYLSRVDEYVSSPLTDCTEARLKIDECWNKLVRTLNYYANERDNSDADVQLIAVAAQGVVNQINELISQVRRSIKASKSASGSNGSNTTNSGSNTNGTSGNTGSTGSTGSTGGATEQKPGGTTTTVVTTINTDTAVSTDVKDADAKDNASGANQNSNGGHTNF